MLRSSAGLDLSPSVLGARSRCAASCCRTLPASVRPSERQADHARGPRAPSRTRIARRHRCIDAAGLRPSASAGGRSLASASSPSRSAREFAERLATEGKLAPPIAPTAQRSWQFYESAAATSRSGWRPPGLTPAAEAIIAEIGAPTTGVSTLRRSGCPLPQGRRGAHPRAARRRARSRSASLF